MFGKVQEVPADRGDALLPPLALRRGQALRPLDHRELPRELRPPRQLAASCSTTRAPAAGLEFVTRKISHTVAQIKLGHGQRAAARQPRGPARLGLRRRLRRGHVADAPAGRARTTTSSPPARPTRCGSSASWPSATSASTGRTTSWSTSGSIRPAEVDLLIGDPAKAQRGARLGAQDHRSPSWCDDGRRRPRPPVGRPRRDPVTVAYEWRGGSRTTSSTRLHAEGFDHRVLDDDWAGQVERLEPRLGDRPPRRRASSAS